MRKEVPREPATKGVKRSAPVAAKAAVKKKKEGGDQAKPKPKKRGSPKVVLARLKLSPTTSANLHKQKQAKEAKKETNPKPVKPKPKKVIVSKATKQVAENESKRAAVAKIERAVKDVKKAKSVVASKIVKSAPKKLSDSGGAKKISSGINVVKKHNIVKRVNKMSGKKPCVVSVKISNAHSTVTLSVKQNKQINKKDLTKKLPGAKNSDRSTISIVKKGIASRRKSTSKECTSRESTPSHSPTRDTSPMRSKEVKALGKGKKDTKMPKKVAKQASFDMKKASEDKLCDGKRDENDDKHDDGKTEVFINESVKIKTENVGEDQNMEIEFTHINKDGIEEKHCKLDGDKNNEGKDKNNKTEIVSSDFKSKSPSSDYNNLKSNDSTTSDEIPLDILKTKQKTIKIEKMTDNSAQELKIVEKTKKGKELDQLDCSSQGDDESSRPSAISEKKKSEKQTKSSKDLSAVIASAKMDAEDHTKLNVPMRGKGKELAIKNKVAKLVKKSKLREQKQKLSDDGEEGKSSDSDQSRKRQKLLKFWNGPKRHRVASLNALAKVHCLYENESRGALNDVISSAAILQRAIQESKKLSNIENKVKKPVVKKPVPKNNKAPEPTTSTRSLRTNPGIRSVGRNFDILNVISSTSLSSSSSSEESSDSGERKKQLVLLPSVKQKQMQIKKEESEQTTDDENATKSQISNESNIDGVKKIKKRRRKRDELKMDLKDMVVRKRMASLNASAIMTATYSNEKKIEIKKDDDKEIKKEKKKRKKEVTSTEADESSGEEDVIMHTTNNKQKVAVILNQDTDVTITGVYVNSTTRSTHHEGYCSIAGMQYRISSTSHTQTEATAVATEAVLHAEHEAAVVAKASPCQSYTPLSALSSMQPPGPRHGAHHSPLQRRHGCPSAFAAPTYPQPPPPAPPHPHHPPPHHGPPQPAPPPHHPDVHGYYQPAGPLISHHHHHHSSSVAAKLPPAPPPSTPASLPTPTPPPSGATHAPSESSDSDVVLTSVENPHPAPYRPYPPPPPHHSQPPYGYNYQYYPSPPASNLQYPGQPSHFHQEICYPPSGYPPGYYPKGHYPPGYRRYHDYYPPPPPREFYPAPGVNPPPPLSAGQQVMVSAPGQPSASYPPSDGGYPPLTPVVDPYPPSAPPHPYPGYGAGPPPPCYTTHSPSSRGLFIDAAAFQGCPCPMQSCPKNVHTGPLTGASKGSMKHGHPQPTPLPPVALALPQEPPGALNPPSPARGSAGVPPPSPAPARQWLEPPPAPAPAPIDTANTTGLLTIGRAVTESVLLGDNTPLVPKTEPSEEELSTIKQEAPSPDDPKMCFRKRYKTVSPDIKRQDFEPPEVETTVQTELQERLITPKEEPEKTILPEDRPVEKQLPLSDKAANVPVPPVLNGHVAKTKKRKSVTSECEPTAKVAKCLQSQKFLKCTKRNKRVAEENIAPDVNSNVEPAKVICRRNSKSVERRKSCPNLTSPAVEEVSPPIEDTEGAKKKKGVRAKKVQAKTKADHLLRSHGKTELLPSTILKERRPSKSAVSAKKAAPPEQAAAAIDPSAESAVCLPGLRPSSLQPKWSNGWFWEGAPFKAKIFLNIDDGAVMRTCYPAMRHAQGDVISPRDCILLKSGQRRGDLPFVAKVAAMWEDPDSGEMMVSLLWYYRPEHTEQGRRSEDIPDEIFASRHKDTNSVACIEDKCYVLTFNEYCRYRKTVRWSEEGLPSAGRIVPPPDPPYQRVHRQPPGRVAPELVFFCRRVYDFRQKRTLKNPC